jgi:hypothetical protein
MASKGVAVAPVPAMKPVGNVFDELDSLPPPKGLPQALPTAGISMPQGARLSVQKQAETSAPTPLGGMMDMTPTTMKPIIYGILAVAAVMVAVL